MSYIIVNYTFNRKNNYQEQNFFTEIVTSLNGFMTNEDYYTLLSAAKNNPQAANTLNDRYSYPVNIEQKPIDTFQFIQPLLKYRDYIRVSKQICENFETLIYPTKRMPCGGEDGNAFDKDGAYRSIFDCAKYFYDGEYNVIEFPENSTLYHGSAGLIYSNSEFPLGIEYYDINKGNLSSEEKEKLTLTEKDKQTLRKNTDQKAIANILKRIQAPINLSFYGDLQTAMAYSNGTFPWGGKCSNRCTNAYKVVKSLVLLDLSNPYTIRKIIDTLTLRDQFLFSTYHGQEWEYGGVKLNWSKAESFTPFLQMFAKPDNYAEKFLFINFVTKGINDWKSKFFDTIGILPSNLVEQFYYIINHGEKIRVTFRDDMKLPKDIEKELTITKDSKPEILDYVIDSIRAPKSYAEKLVQQEVEKAVQKWKEKYPNNYRNDDQKMDLISFNRYNPIRRFMAYNLKRDSMRHPDYILPNILMRYCEKLGYAGYSYINTATKTGFRFGEVVLGNYAKDYLKRDYNNPYDWQYNDDKYIFGSIGKLIKDMKSYKTTNVEFHAGDLLEHSVWTAMYMQWMIKNKHPALDYILDDIEPQNRDNYRKMMIATAFLHDIGKGGDFILAYYDKPTHPEKGYDYLMKDYITLENGVINMKDLMAEMGIDKYSQYWVRFLVRYHWDIGRFMSEYNDENKLAQAVFNRYEQMCDESKIQSIEYNQPARVRKHLFISLYALWSADLMASQPFIGKEKIKELVRKIGNNTDYAGFYINEYLEDFPYISNLPKIHRGDDKYRRFKIQDVDNNSNYINDGKGLRMLKNVLQLIDAKYNV